ncbi:MAG: cohesin domain-containing protein [Candidatus Nealsonbacteria bacterium]|nr:cohesin domain-containing protein [Candidatus Nealsonbacteria bacterium]
MKHKNIFNLLFLFSIFCFTSSILPGEAKAQSASFYLSPSKGNYRIGANFVVDVMVNAEKISLNAAQAKIFFPPDRLKVIDISKQNSIFSLWAQEPIFSNSEGEIYFVGGLPTPGFRGETGKVITIIFQAKSLGEAKIHFSEEIIMANAPEGIDIFSFSQGGSFAFSQGGIYAVLGSDEILEELPKDKQPPFPFEIIIDDEGDPTNPQPLLYFETTDELSGMGYYEIKIGEEDFFRVAVGETKPFRLSHLTPGIHQITVRAFDKAGNYIDSATEVKVESIVAPEITICPGTYNAEEEILYVGGIALPNHTVIIFLKTNDKIIKSWEVYSDEKGEWFLEEDGLFKPGTYKISARAKDVRGAVSNFSKECIIEIFLGGFAIGPWIIGYKTLTLFTLIILIIILFGIFYLFWKIRKNQRIIKRETQDLKQKFYKEYKELQDDILKELTILKKTRAEGEITVEEKKREEELLKNLEDVKTVLEKELKDIEEIK